MGYKTNSTHVLKACSFKGIAILSLLFYSNNNYLFASQKQTKIRQKVGKNSMCMCVLKARVTVYSLSKKSLADVRCVCTYVGRSKIYNSDFADFERKSQTEKNKTF